MGYIICVLVGVIAVLTVENTILLHRKPKDEKPAELTEEQKRKKQRDEQLEKEFDELMNYKGRQR